MPVAWLTCGREIAGEPEVCQRSMRSVVPNVTGEGVEESVVSLLGVAQFTPLMVRQASMVQLVPVQVPLALALLTVMVTQSRELPLLSQC